jgi:glutamate 5-kinase
MRLVVKVGSSSLTTGGRLDVARLQALVDVLAARRHAGTSVVLVSSGAIAAGITPLHLTKRPRDLPTQQAAASVGQGALIAAYQRAFARHGLTVGQVLLTVEDVTRRAHYGNARRTLDRLLDFGVVPVVNENDTVATSEIRFGDNDRLAALVAHLVSDVDGLYDGSPTRPGATRLDVVHSADDLARVDVGGIGSSVGTGGMATKVEAAAIATAAGIPTLLTSAALADVALSDDPAVGTIFVATGRRKPSRLLWLAHASKTHGRLLLDDGAVRAVVERSKSLLPAGITSVDGDFGAGEPVDLCRLDGGVVARGLVNYSSDELPALLGRSTRELARELGPEYEREVVHRDDLVVLV